MALTRPVTGKYETGKIVQMVAGEAFQEGSILSVGSNGKVRKARTDAGDSPCGLALDKATAVDDLVRVDVGGPRVTVSSAASFTQADVGATVYLTDENTVAKTGSTNRQAARVVKVHSANSLDIVLAPYGAEQAS